MFKPLGVWMRLNMSTQNNINEQTKQEQTHRYREQTNGCQRGGRAWGLGKKVKELRSMSY